MINSVYLEKTDLKQGYAPFNYSVSRLNSFMYSLFIIICCLSIIVIICVINTLSTIKGKLMTKLVSIFSYLKSILSNRSSNSTAIILQLPIFCTSIIGASIVSLILMDRRDLNFEEVLAAVFYILTLVVFLSGYSKMYNWYLKRSSKDISLLSTLYLMKIYTLGVLLAMIVTTVVAFIWIYLWKALTKESQDSTNALVQTNTNELLIEDKQTAKLENKESI